MMSKQLYINVGVYRGYTNTESHFASLDEAYENLANEYDRADTDYSYTIEITLDSKGLPTKLDWQDLRDTLSAWIAAREQERRDEETNARRERENLHWRKP